MISSSSILQKNLTLDSYSHLNKCKVWYDGLEKETTLVVGFPLRDDSEVIEDKEGRWMAYADPTQGPDNGKAMVGIIADNKVDSIFKKDDHSLMSVRISPSDSLSYQWGFAWDKTDITSMDEWKDYLEKVNNKRPAPKVPSNTSGSGPLGSA